MKKIDDFVAMVPTMTAQAAETDQPTMEVVKKDGRTVVTSQSKIVKGRAERVIGAGHFVVYPNENESADVVKTGNQVMVLTDMKLFLDITLEGFSHVVVFQIFMLDGRAFSHSLSAEQCGFRDSLGPTCQNALCGARI